jgi:hypothetical protein
MRQVTSFHSEPLLKAEKDDSLVGDKGLRKLAATLILEATENIKAKAVYEVSRTDYKKDLRWIHSAYSDFEDWCAIINIDPQTVRSKFPQ